jgi:hypothetical protein
MRRNTRQVIVNARSDVDDVRQAAGGAAAGRRTAMVTTMTASTVGTSAMSMVIGR